MIRRNTNKFLISAGAVAAIAMAMILMAAQPAAQAQESGQDASVKVGTYDAETAFQAHPAQKELMKAVKTAQADMQQAQQDQDQQKIQQIQQNFEQTRRKAVEQFEDDISEALPEAAKAAGVKVVAMQVVYKADDVKSVDITGQITKKFDSDDDDDN
ncbi:MAG: hypothetical protein ACOCVI_01815 [Planctomycetota bacterium]